MCSHTADQAFMELPCTQKSSFPPQTTAVPKQSHTNNQTVQHQQPIQSRSKKIIAVNKSRINRN